MVPETTRHLALGCHRVDHGVFCQDIFLGGHLEVHMVLGHLPDILLHLLLLLLMVHLVLVHQIRLRGHVLDSDLRLRGNFLVLGVRMRDYLNLRAWNLPLRTSHLLIGPHEVHLLVLRVGLSLLSNLNVCHVVGSLLVDYNLLPVNWFFLTRLGGSSVLSERKYSVGILGYFLVKDILSSYLGVSEALEWGLTDESAQVLLRCAGGQGPIYHIILSTSVFP